MSYYNKLELHFRRIGSFEHIRSICFWDEACMMPKGGSEARAQAMADLGTHIHNLLMDPHIEDWLCEAENKQEQLTVWQQANLKQMRKEWFSHTALDAELIEEKILACARSETAWRELRAQNDWENYLPYFEKVVEVVRREGEIKGQKMKMSPYDALIQNFEPGQSSEKLQQIFDILALELPGLINLIIEKQSSQEVKKLTGIFPEEKQRQFGLEVMRTLGFNFEHGRLDISTHPFCGGVPQDVRITTRYSEQNFLEGLYGVIHETGHALYEQHLPKEWDGQPVGRACSMGIHEGQSLLFEMQIAHSTEFIDFLISGIQNYFNDMNVKWDRQELVRLINHVEKGLIRVNSDEVTYPVHIILRFEIEKRLIAGDIKVSDVPELWDHKMQELLNLSTAGDYKNGCLQDVHWPSGAFGYFPSYSLGAMNAAQLFAKIKSERPDVAKEIRTGNFLNLNQWLQEKVWSQASFLSAEELMVSATGEQLNPNYFLKHLKERYL